MASENQFLLHAFLLGIYIAFLYDLIRIFRRVFPRGILLVSAEDLMFWFYCGIEVFLLMYRESAGELRWFAVLGAMTGIFLYQKLVSPWFVRYVSTFGLWIKKRLTYFFKMFTMNLKKLIVRNRRKESLWQEPEEK